MAERIWRVGMVGSCFAVIGAGALVFSLLLFPVLRLLPGGNRARERRVRALIRWSFIALLYLLQALRMMRLEVRGAAALRNTGKVLVVANHPSYLDVVALIAQIPDAGCVVKSRLWQHPFFGGVVRAAGYLRNDEPEALLHGCVECLSSGSPLIIFPEGTRSLPGEPLHFMRGAARIALQSDAAILPVVIRCDPPALVRGAQWYDVPAGPFRLFMEVLPRTNVAALMDTAVPVTRPGARALTRALERIFKDCLDGHERFAA